MKDLRFIFGLTALFLLPVFTNAQVDSCAEFNKVLGMMKTGFSTTKVGAGKKTITQYEVMEVTETLWPSNYKFPESLTSNITEMSRKAPDPRMAGHNVYITCNFAKNITQADARAIYNRVKEKIRNCAPKNWKTKEVNEATYARFMMMDGPYYDDAANKVTLLFNRLPNSDKYTADIIFDTAVK